MTLVLSLFPGIGLLDMAFEEEGFCVVRGPDLLWGGDVRRFHPPAGKFDGVIGGPPCQAFSRLRHLVEANGYQTAENLIPQFERCVILAAPRWYLMENVQDAPLPEIVGYHRSTELIRDVWVGGHTTRMRRFSFGSRDGQEIRVEHLALHRQDPKPTVVCDARDVPVAVGGSGKPKKRKNQGSSGTAPHEGKKLPVAEMLIRQGCAPDMLDDSPLTDAGKRLVVGNGVPLAMGRAVARAVRNSVYIHLETHNG